MPGSHRLPIVRPITDGEASMDILIADVIGDVALVLVVSSLLGALARRWGSHGSSA